MSLPLGIDDELDEERDLLRTVGKAREIPDYFENCPQSYLEATHHPYAPFTGDTIHWNSWVYDDATTFEGLTRDAVPHGKGTMTFGKQGKGAGVPNTKPGDRYEGEFHGGFAHGVGIFTGVNGVVFKGEFSAGLRDGCGAEYNLEPWHRRMKQGMDPAKAWREAKEEIQESIVLGSWNNDVFTSGPTDLGTGCSIGEIKRTLYETDSQVARARMFQFKPGGDANFYKCHFERAPVKAMQHPLHYPHGTLFMAPGPAGQTAGIPNDKGLRRLMLREFHNYNVVYSSYNFDYKPASDSLMAKAMRWWDKQQALRKREEALEAKIADQQMRRVTGKGAGAAGGTKPDTTSKSKRKEDIDESDLLASAAVAASESPDGLAPVHSAFGSVAMSAQSRPRKLLAALAKKYVQVARIAQE